jgi:glutathione reductase (NADPH)
MLKTPSASKPTFDYDLFVIGAGSGGVRMARMSAQYGAKVAIAEEQHLGGTCVNVGCVPKKLFVYAAEFSESFHNAQGFGWSLTGQQTHNWPTLLHNKNAEIERLNGVYRNLLVNSGCDLIESRAVVTGPNSVQVGGKTVTAKYILVATGGYPFVPEVEGKALAITSNEAFYLPDLPEKIIIVGGGYIAVEFAGIFNGLGVEVDLVYRGPKILRTFDQDLSSLLPIEMEKKGIHIHLNANIDSIVESATGTKIATLTNGETIEAGEVMYATGRKPYVEGLGLETTSVALNNAGAIQVDEQFRTAEPSIFAVGDVIDRVQLTPVALAEGMALSGMLFNNQPFKMDYSDIATAVFSQPNIGTVGLTETQARDQFVDIDIYKSSFKAMKQTLAGGDEQTFMKLIVDKSSDRVVGCHMLGESAGEIMQGIGIAIKAGATKAHFDATIGIHPTSAEEFVTMRTPVAY